MGTKKQYSAEFKQDAVNYYYSSGKSIKEAAEDLKLAPQVLIIGFKMPRRMMV